MTPLGIDQVVLLTKALEKDYVPHLPPLLDMTRPETEQQRKNLSRALSAFILRNVVDISPKEAARAVVDDFDDYGIDAVYYSGPTETLYLVQSKLKSGAEFTQDEALAYCQGVRKLIKQDFDGFNQNIQNRKLAIEDALENCSHIQLAIGHIGTGLSEHAKGAIQELLNDEDHGEERFEKQIIDFDAKRVVDSLRSAQAHERVDTYIKMQRCASIAEPRLTYFGMVLVEDLVSLHKKHGKDLFAKNIRTFLGSKTDVNTSIRDTLATRPKEFFYFNNGVTALCGNIEPKGSPKGGGKRFKIRGFSVVNGAQTIASSADFVDNKEGDLSGARVLLTLIQADSDGEFGKKVTRARNHQNPVLTANFAALDDEQERLRCDLAYLGIHYAYKAGGPEELADPNRIRIDEAAQALALLQDDPRYVIWLKKEPARILDTESPQYKSVFTPVLTAFQLLNAVILNRYVQDRIVKEVSAAFGQTRLVYKHGNYALAWVLAKRVRSSINSAAKLDDGKLKIALSAPFDQLRNTLLTRTQPAMTQVGPLSIFRNQTRTVPILQEVMIENYGLAADTVVTFKIAQQPPGQPYPVDLFSYLASKAPQIGNVI